MYLCGYNNRSQITPHNHYSGSARQTLDYFKSTQDYPNYAKSSLETPKCFKVILGERG